MSDHAVQAIRGDLAALAARRRRAGRLGAVVLAAFAGGLAGIAVVPVEGLWIAATLLLLSAAWVGLLGAVGALRRTGRWSALAALLLLLGLGFAVELAAEPRLDPRLGLPCLGIGAAVAFGSIALLTRAVGPLWPRFAELWPIAAAGATAVGLAWLNARCAHADPAHLLGYHLPILAGVGAALRGLLRVG